MDKQQAEICETYQLKWGSFSSYMHSCISSSLYGDTFADVALVTADGHQIMAHRYVLSYSSLFLAHVLKLHRKVTTALPLMVVMPPEIDHKSLKVLVRYMYSGEAKVSKEILKNVLRGGDILQIKGLYREKENEDKNVKITQQPHKTTATIPSASPASPAVPPMIPIVKPAIKATPTATQTSKSSENNPKSPQKTAPQKFLLVQKQKEQVVTYANARQKAKVLNFTLMHSFDKTGQSPITEEPEKRVTILNKQLDPLVHHHANDNTIKTEPSGVQYLMIKDEPIEWCEADMDLIDSRDYDDVNMKSEPEEVSSDNNGDEDKMFSPLTCELCTETFTVPREWVRHVQTHTDMLPAKRRRRDSKGDSYENRTFPELMCDLCQIPFPTPAEWVKHIDKTHTELELHLFNKKNTDSYENDTFPELMCDLCQKPFPTPAEWVKHIHKTHTEFELHLSNKKSLSSKKSPTDSPKAATPPPQTMDATKHCADCNKSFPSHASMIIHKRSHTGEKPFNCDMCSKTFNVKSNLLRHLRTIHNKIINSTEIDNREEDSNS